MKKMKINAMKIGTIFSIILLTTLFSLPFAQAIGVTRPVPLAVKLLRGESQVFRFQVQATTSTTDQSCTYSMEGLDPLVLVFENPEGAMVEAGGTQYVYFTLNVPTDAPTKGYEGKLIVKCGDKQAATGITGSAVYSTINSPFTVDVVLERVTGKPEMTIPEAGMSYETLAIIGAGVIILIVGVYYFYRKAKAKSRTGR
jgi:hypothetical protein